jgi:hypothetical protein
MPTKKEPQLVEVSHVPELIAKKEWDFPEFYRQLNILARTARGTAKKAWDGKTDLDKKTIINLARLFGCDKPYEQVLEVRLQ